MAYIHHQQTPVQLKGWSSGLFLVFSVCPCCSVSFQLMFKEINTCGLYGKVIFSSEFGCWITQVVLAGTKWNICDDENRDTRTENGYTLYWHRFLHYTSV